MGPVSPRSRLAPALLLGLLWLAAPPASAQSLGLVVRDGTLGSAPEGVVAPGPDDLGTADYLIRADLGEQRGGNLFHSFARFSIGSGERATFTDQGAPDPGAIENVISRVTGGELSQIDGMLHSTIPGADVWLLNPSGVVFGAGAELDVKGSFHASTGDYVGFEGGLERFYVDGRPSSVLATAPPTAFGFLPESDAALLAVDRSQLRIDPGETLELVGGDVTLTGATLLAPGGHVGLEAQGDVRLTDAIVGGEPVPSLVDVGGEAPGTASIRGGQILIEKGSQVLAENESPVPPPVADTGERGPGSISVAAGGSLTIDNGLLSVNTRSAGDAGTIHLASPVITVQNGPGIVEVPSSPSDVRNDPHATKVGVSAETEAGGRGGEIAIEAGTLTVKDGASVSARSFENEATPVLTTGDAGTIRVDVDRVKIENRSELAASVWRSQGNAGAIDLDVAESLLVDGKQGYAWINTSSVFDKFYDDGTREGVQAVPGAPGRITITGPGGRAGSVEILNSGMILSACLPCTSKLGDPDRPEDAGTIRIAANHLLVQGWGATSSDAAHVAAYTTGVGDAGSVEIDAGRVELLDSGLLGAPTHDAGNAGAVDVDADELVIRGAAPDRYPAGIYVVSTGSGGAGTVTVGRGYSGGAVTIDTGGTIAVDAGSSSNAPLGGSIEFDVDSLDVSGGNLLAETFGASPGGTIAIDARSLNVSDGGNISARSASTGDAGTIEITVRTLEVDHGGQINAGSVYGGQADGSGGRGGEIHIHAEESIFLHDGEDYPLSAVLAGARATGILSASHKSLGGGSITLDAPVITVDSSAVVATTTIAGGKGGDVLLGEERTRRILVGDGGLVDSSSLLTGAAAGSVTLRASESIEVVGGDRFAGQVSSGTLSDGDAGSVTLQAPRIVVDGGIVTTLANPLKPEFFGSREGGAGGVIELDAGSAGGQVIVQRGGQVTASTLGSGDAGGISIRAGESIRVQDADSRITTRTGASGFGGNIVLSAPRIEVAAGGEVSAESAAYRDELGNVDFGDLGGPNIALFLDDLRDPPEVATGRAGSIALAASQLVHLDDGDITTSSPRGVATGGDITIDPVFVILQNGSRIEATADQGQGGHIQITTDNFFAFPRSVVSAASGNPALSGTVEIHSPDVNLAGTLTPLPSTFLDAASLMRERCAARRHGERSGSFAVRGPGGIPSEPDGWLRAPVVLPDPAATATTTPGPLALVASLPGLLLAHGACP